MRDALDAAPWIVCGDRPAGLQQQRRWHQQQQQQQ
jgi:hypothetical protein